MYIALYVGNFKQVLPDANCLPFSASLLVLLTNDRNSVIRVKRLTFSGISSENFEPSVNRNNNLKAFIVIRFRLLEINVYVLLCDMLSIEKRQRITFDLHNVFDVVPHLLPYF